MISSLHFGHFKCFQSLRLELGNLTLLTGFNAAGKSTSCQPLLLLAQGLRTAPSSGDLGLNGPMVRLGTAGEVLSRDSSDQLMHIAVESSNVKLAWLFRPAERTGSGALAIERGSLEIEGRAERTWSAAIRPNDLELRRADPLFEAIKETVYVSATRLGAAKTFPSPDDAGVSFGDVGPYGEYAPWWYCQFADEEVEVRRRHVKESGLTLRRQLDAFLGDLFPGGQATAELIPRTSRVRLGLRTDIESDWRRPVNTGYGMTYAFPILVSLLLAKAGQVVIIDSPEAHLHPSGQSTMGRLLAHFANAGIQLIVETHSDHVLNGIRCAVRDQTTGPDAIVIYFFGAAGSVVGEQRVSSLRVDRAGNIDNWPPGFFDQSERDLARLAGWE